MSVNDSGLNDESHPANIVKLNSFSEWQIKVTVTFFFFPSFSFSLQLSAEETKSKKRPSLFSWFSKANFLIWLRCGRRVSSQDAVVTVTMKASGARRASKQLLMAAVSGEWGGGGYQRQACKHQTNAGKSDEKPQVGRVGKWVGQR